MENEKKKKINAETAPDFPAAGKATVSKTAKPGEVENPLKKRREKAKAKAAAEYVSPSAGLGEMELKAEHEENP